MPIFGKYMFIFDIVISLYITVHKLSVLLVYDSEASVKATYRHLICVVYM